MSLSARHLLPRPATLLLFAILVFLWYPILSDRVEDWGPVSEDVGVPVLVLSIFGLCGVYGGTVTDKLAQGVSQRGRLLLVFARTTLLATLAVGAAMLLFS